MKRRASIEVAGERLFRCPQCRRFLRKAEYSRHPSRPDGIHSYCLECKRAEGRARAALPSVKETRRRWAQGIGRVAMNRYRQRHPGKVYAQSTLQRTVAAGLIARQTVCSECSGEYHVEAHHDDYAKPLEVRWLCRLCHRAWHTEHGEAVNADLPHENVRARQQERKAARIELIPNMLAGGMTQKRIAEAFGVTQATICQDIKRINSASL